VSPLIPCLLHQKMDPLKLNIVFFCQQFLLPLDYLINDHHLTKAPPPPPPPPPHKEQRNSTWFWTSQKAHSPKCMLGLFVFPQWMSYLYICWFVEDNYLLHLGLLLHIIISIIMHFHPLSWTHVCSNLQHESWHEHNWRT